MAISHVISEDLQELFLMVADVLHGDVEDLRLTVKSYTKDRLEGLLHFLEDGEGLRMAGYDDDDVCLVEELHSEVSELIAKI